MQKKRALLILMALPLLSCGNTEFVYSPYVYSPLETRPFYNVRYDGYKKVGEFSNIEAADAVIEPTLSSVLAHGGKRKCAAPLGESKITVIPVEFSDYRADELEQTHGGKAIEMIRGAFFGSGNSNQFVSVAEYYDSSSFHRLHIVGDVDDAWFTPKETLAELKTKHSSSSTKAALSSIYNQAIEWHNLRSESKLEAGDPVYFVYCAPYSGYESGQTDRSSMLWAFTVNEPSPIAWSSFYMSHPDSGKLDAHTYIHETGHLLGLKDYYDTNAVSDFSSVSPLGRMDMMDCSLGEQNAFSKLTLGWNRPFVPTSSCTVTLRQGPGNGDCLLLSPSWNGSPFDEYLLLEFYTPTLLNKVDAYLRADPAMRLMNKAGVKVYHVDARLGLFEERRQTPLALVTKETVTSGKIVDFYQNNSSSSKEYLVELIDASAAEGGLIKGYVASDHIETIGNASLRDVLFTAGQGSASPVFSGFRFHNGKELGLSFTVESVETNSATVRVELEEAK